MAVPSVCPANYTLPVIFHKNVPLHPVWVSGELQLVCDSWYFLQNDSKRVTHVNKLFLKGPPDVNTGVTMAK